jgi:hypothetical protein
MSNFGNKLLRVVSQRVGDLGVPRNDLRLVDFAPSGPITAQVLLQHDPVRATPSLKQIEAWFVEKFGNRIRPNLETARTYDKEPAISLYANLNVPHRPLSDADGMQRVGGLDTYMDANTGNVWDVRENENGTKFLVARTDDDLNSLLEQVKTRGHGRAFLASVQELRKHACMCSVGDTVKFIDADNVCRGEVVSMKGDTVTISANNTKVTVDKGQVVEILRRNPDAINDTRVTMQDYFTKAFGDAEYAEQLTNTMSTDRVGPQKV